MIKKYSIAYTETSSKILICFSLKILSKMQLQCSTEDFLSHQGLRDHPYITSAHFWNFSEPPTHPPSAKIVHIECQQN